jgi:hypothetical protein
MKLKPPAETFDFKRKFTRVSSGIIWDQIRQGVFDPIGKDKRNAPIPFKRRGVGNLIHYSRTPVTSVVGVLEFG